MCDVKFFNVVWNWVVWNANWTLLSTYDVECGRNTHTQTHESNGTQLHAHRQSNQSAEEKRWALRADLNDTTGGRYLFVIRCYVEWNVVWWGMSVAWMDYRVWSGAEWCEDECMVWNGGVKLQRGVECHGVILNVLWYGYIKLCVAFRAVCSLCIT